MKVLALSRERVGAWIPMEFSIIISITDPSSPPAFLPINGFVKAVLRLSFHDIDRSYGDIPELILFSDEQADEILNFMKSNVYEVTCIVCHCEAGVSRSRGVAAALQKILFDDDSAAFKRGRPNMHVYSTLLRRWHEMLRLV